MIEFKINGKSIRTIGEQLPDKILSLEIHKHPMFSQQLTKQQTLHISNWLWDIVQRLEDEWIIYNGIFIQKSDVKQYKTKGT